MKQSRITDVRNSGSQPLEVLKNYHLAFLLATPHRRYLLYAAGIGINKYEIKLVRVTSDPEVALPIFLKECYSTELFARDEMAAQDLLDQMLDELDGDSIEDPIQLVLEFGGLASRRPLDFPKEMK